MKDIHLILFRWIIKFITIFTFTLAIILIPLPLIILYIWKSIVNSLASIFQRDLSPMKVMDSVTGVLIDSGIENPKSNIANGNIGFTFKLNGKVEGETFFQEFEKKVINIDNSKGIIDPNHKHIRFYRSIQRFCGYWFFKTFHKALKYEDHMTCKVLKANISYEETICKWLKVRYDLKKCPLWGILLIYREESHDTIFAFKIHHLLADGYSALHILDLLTDTKHKYQVDDFHDTKWEKFKVLIKSSYSFIEYYINTFISVPVTPFHRRTNDEDIFLSHVTVPLSFVKAIRKNCQVRFQSVMLSLVTNYINSLILETAEENSKIPEKILIFKSLPWPNHPQIELCNHYTSGLFGFKIRSNTSNQQQESLYDINTIFEDFHKKNFDKATYHLLNSSEPMPVQLMLATCNEIFYNRISCHYAHLIASEEYSNVFGMECRDVSALMMPANQKFIAVCGLTISNEIRLSIMGPKSLFPSQELADKFSKDSFQRHISGLLENMNTTNTTIN